MSHSTPSKDTLHYACLDTSSSKGPLQTQTSNKISVLLLKEHSPEFSVQMQNDTTALKAPSGF